MAKFAVCLVLCGMMFAGGLADEEHENPSHWFAMVRRLARAVCLTKPDTTQCESRTEVCKPLMNLMFRKNYFLYKMMRASLVKCVDVSAHPMDISFLPQTLHELKRMSKGDTIWQIMLDNGYPMDELYHVLACMENKINNMSAFQTCVNAAF